MQAKVVAISLGREGKRRLNLRFGMKPADFLTAFSPDIHVDEDELSLVGLALGDVLEVDFAPARSTQATIDRAVSEALAPGRETDASGRPV